ncbi:HAD-IC family P-type ATPase [Protofrankia coriariae]|uniref:HAD-IC family P-type ATPase n=1 Tax=Protofrankia coriariae TaxID=1562887 RepID=UPI003083F901
MNPGALRLLDRIDTVVVDSDVLVGTAFTVGEVIPLAGADASEVAVRAYALFRPTDPAATTEADGWTLAPIERLVGNGGSGDNGPDNDGPDGDGPGRAQWRRLRAAGVHTILGLAQGTAVTAVVTAVPERAEGAEALLASCRRSGLTVWVAGGVACPDDGFGFPVIPGGHRLPAAVGDLRAAGAGVLVVSHRRPAVGGADCGVGVDGPDGAPAWGADVLVGTDLPTAAMMVEAAAVAARVSRRAVRLARIGSGAGALVALTSTGPRLLSRAMLMVNGAGALAFGDGVWAARELDRRPPPPSIPRTPWHVLSTRRVLAGLGSSADGLTSAQVASRRADDVPGGTGAPGLFAALARELASPLTPVLLGGAALSAASGSVLDAGLVVSVAVMSALVGAVQQRRADRALARLFARSALRARARRDGADVELTARELVPGDVISIGPGDVVPADARLLSATSLEVDESSLTGESLPVTKSSRPVAASYVAERSSMVYEGTTVVAGAATAAVVATGPATEAGRGMAAAAGPAKAVGVEARLAAITEFTAPVVLGAAAVLLASGLVRGRPAGPARRRHAERGCGARRRRGARGPAVPGHGRAAVRGPAAVRPRRAGAQPADHRNARTGGRAVLRQDRHAHQRQDPSGHGVGRHPCRRRRRADGAAAPGGRRRSARHPGAGQRAQVVPSHRPGGDQGRGRHGHPP